MLDLCMSPRTCLRATRSISCVSLACSSRSCHMHVEMLGVNMRERGQSTPMSHLREQVVSLAHLATQGLQNHLPVTHMSEECDSCPVERPHKLSGYSRACSCCLRASSTGAPASCAAPTQSWRNSSQYDGAADALPGHSRACGSFTCWRASRPAFMRASFAALHGGAHRQREHSSHRRQAQSNTETRGPRARSTCLLEVLASSVAASCAALCCPSRFCATARP